MLTVNPVSSHFVTTPLQCQCTANAGREITYHEQPEFAKSMEVDEEPKYGIYGKRDCRGYHLRRTLRRGVLTC